MTWNPNEALGLPPGSVRAILALIVTGVAVAVIAKLGWFDTSSNTQAMSHLKELSLLALGYYFGKGSGSNGQH